MQASTVFKLRWWALTVLVLCVLVTGFDTTILNVALPTLSIELNASNSQLQWIVDAYLLVFSALLLPAGSFGDRYGRKKVLFLGLIIFGITSVLAGYASSTKTLIIARACMGAGGAIIMPLTYSILPTVFTTEERSKATSIWAAGSGVGLLIGPILGGSLLSHFAWGSVFLVNVPIIILILAGGYFLLPESKNLNVRRTDWMGILLSCAGLSALVYGIIQAPQDGWLTAKVLYSIICGVLLLALFVIWQKIASDPVLDLKLMRNSRFIWATVAVSIIMFVLNGVLFFVTQYLQFTLGNTAYGTGVKLVPFMVAMVVGSLLSNRLTALIGTKWTVASGLLLMAAGLFLFSTAQIDDTYSFAAICFMMIGIGVGIALAPSLDAVMEALPISEVGVGSAVNNTFRQVSGTLGVAILGSIVSSVFKYHLQSGLDQVPGKYLEPMTKSVGAATQIALKLQYPIRESILAKVNTSFLTGMSLALVISTVAILIGLILTVSFLPSRSTKYTKQRNRIKQKDQVTAEV